MAMNTYNLLTIVGDSELIRDVIDGVLDGGDVNFNTIVPVPTHMYTGDIKMQDTEDFGDLNWIDWCYDNWGTNWNDWAGDTYQIYFETANGVPFPIITAFANECSMEFTHMFGRRIKNYGDVISGMVEYAHQLYVATLK